MDLLERRGVGDAHQIKVSHGILYFFDFFKIDFMVGDLSRSVSMVFKSPGNPLIKLFDFICNWNVSFYRQIVIQLFIELFIELPIVLPCYSLVEEQ